MTFDRCLVVIDGTRCSLPPHEGRIHNIRGVLIEPPPERPLPLSWLKKVFRRG